MKPILHVEDKDRNRRKLLYVAEERVLEFLAQSRFNATGMTYIAMPWALELPDDVKVIGVWTDFISRSFVFALQSKTFDEVPECCVAPRLDVEWEYLEAKVQRPKPPQQ